jgi:hypothetical protein
LRASIFMDFDPQTVDQSLNYGVAATVTVSMLALDAVGTGLALRSGVVNPKDYQRFRDIVSVLANVSQSVEEDALPTGQIIFSDSEYGSLRRLDFKPTAPLNRHKQVGKLLASVANSQSHCLLSNLIKLNYRKVVFWRNLPAG